MQELKQKALSWWQDLTDQEQKLLTLFAPVVIVVALYWMLWQPLMSSIVQAERALAAEQSSLQRIKASANEYLSKMQAEPTIRKTGSLSQVVSRSAPRHGLTVVRMQPQSDRLSVSLEDASFDSLLNWLEELSSKHGVKVEVLDINAENNQGIVQIRRLQLQLI